MIPETGLEITGDRGAILRFENFPQAAHDRLLTTLQSLEKRLEAAVIAAEPEATGQLRALTGGRVYDHGTRIAAVVGVRTQTPNEARKAAALEYGSRGTPIQVRAHQMSLAHFWSLAVKPISVAVPQYSRTPNIAAQRFLRGPAQALHDQALAEMRAALEAAAQDVN